MSRDRHGDKNSALGNSVPVSLRDISKIDCHNAFFRNALGEEVPELHRFSVKTWHIAIHHALLQSAQRRDPNRAQSHR